MNTTQIIINVLFIFFLFINAIISIICIFHLAENEEDKEDSVFVAGLFGGYAVICIAILFWVMNYIIDCLVF